MGVAHDRIADIVRGNLQGADDNVRRLDKEIAALQAERDKFEGERAELAAMLAAHEQVKP